MLKKIFIIIGILFFLLLLSFLVFRSYTKSFSPEDKIVLDEGDLQIKIEYSRPYKKGRDIFGELVPYGEVWRTGANEATTFKTSKDLIIKNKVLPAGEYSLWTIPEEVRWKVIWNSEVGHWGINLNGKANYNPEHNVLEIDAPVIETSNTFEQFTVDLEKVSNDIHLVLMWDQTMIVIPMDIK